MDALEDPRDATFKDSLRIKNVDREDSEVLNPRNDLAKRFNGVYLTPQFHQAFDIKGIHDYRMLKTRVQYGALSVGVYLVEAITGDTEA